MFVLNVHFFPVCSHLHTTLYTIVLFCMIIWTLFICFGSSPAGSKVKKDDDGSSVCKEVKGILIVIG